MKVPGLDLGKLGSIEEQAIESDRKSPIGAGQTKVGKKLVSSEAEKAKNLLAERAKQGILGTDEEEDSEQRELPEEEFVDFLGTYEEQRWWTIKQKEDKEAEAEKAASPNVAIIEEDEEGEDRLTELDYAPSDMTSNMSMSEMMRVDDTEDGKSNAGSGESTKDEEDENEEEEVTFPTLDEALTKDWNFNEITSLKQRFTDINRQPRYVKELLPAPLQLLTKRVKRCKTCQKQVIKPNINPNSNEPLRVNFLLLFHIPKITIYRIGKLTPGIPQIDLFLQVRNPNMSKAEITFKGLTPD